MRLRIARAEATRGAGIAELSSLAAAGPRLQRVLALRALGRIGGAQAIEVLRGRLADADVELVAAAAGALGVLASLDEPGAEVTAALTAALLAALPRAGARAPIVIEALGRAADASAQPRLVEGLAGASPPIAEASAIALGRHGRRKIALAPAARGALAAAARHADASVRYAAAWALAREHLADGAAAGPGPDVAGALAALVTDRDAEIRAQAIAALARRKLVDGRVERLLARAVLDQDWRPAVEAARAMTGEQSTVRMRLAAARAAAARLGSGPEGQHAVQVAIEVLRGLVGNAAPPPPSGADRAELEEALAELVRAAGKVHSPLARGWIGCLDKVLAARRAAPADFTAVEQCSPDLPEHLRLPLLAELVRAKASTPAARQAAVGKLLAHADVRVRAAGLGALAALWPDGDAAVKSAALAAVIEGLGAQEPIEAGAAAEAAPDIYEVIADADRGALDAAVAARAGKERDVELSASLLELVGKRKIAAGAAACREGLAGHPVRARAAAACLVALGEPAPPARAVAPAPPPPVDVAAVIGHSVRWKLSTTAGPLTIELLPEVAPWAVAAIVALTRKGFYDGLEVHRVVPDFVVQGGDPTESGWGGPGFLLPAEPSDGLAGSGFVAGGVGIADSGRDSGGSQWFVMHSRAPHLDGRYTWIGKVVDGQQAADELVIGDKVVGATVEVSP